MMPIILLPLGQFWLGSELVSLMGNLFILSIQALPFLIESPINFSLDWRLLPWGTNPYTRCVLYCRSTASSFGCAATTHQVWSQPWSSPTIQLLQPWTWVPWMRRKSEGQNVPPRGTEMVLGKCGLPGMTPWRSPRTFVSTIVNMFFFVAALLTFQV